MNQRHKTLAAVLVVLSAGVLGESAAAFVPFQKLFGQKTACAWCGRRDGCQPVCRLVRAEREIKITCWSCRSKPVCLAGASKTAQSRPLRSSVEERSMRNRSGGTA